MRRRLFLATVLTTTAGGTAARASGGFPYGDSLVFAAWRNGQMIGHHAIRFHEDGGQRIASTSIDFSVHMLGMTFYKLNYRCHEAWSGNDLQTLDAETNDDGKKYTVKASRTPGGIVVEHEGPDPMVKTSTGDEAVRPGAPGHEVLPADTLPSTHWNIAQVRQSGLLHTEYGTLVKVAVANAGRETIKTATGTLPATRYDYTGYITMTQWFDDRSRWVKSIFRGPDGSAIEYILQE